MANLAWINILQYIWPSDLKWQLQKESVGILGWGWEVLIVIRTHALSLSVWSVDWLLGGLKLGTGNPDGWLLRGKVTRVFVGLRLCLCLVLPPMFPPSTYPWTLPVGITMSTWKFYVPKSAPNRNKMIPDIENKMAKDKAECNFLSGRGAWWRDEMPHTGSKNGARWEWWEREVTCVSFRKNEKLLSLWL